MPSFFLLQKYVNFQVFIEIILIHLKNTGKCIKMGTSGEKWSKVDISGDGR